MNRIGKRLEQVSASLMPGGFEHFGAAVPMQYIDEALKATGKQSIRKRNLAAPVAVWLVIGMALFRNQAITTVLQTLGLLKPEWKIGLRLLGEKASSSALVQARERLGREPLEHLFDRTAQQWGEETRDINSYKGLQLWGTDGSSLNLADTAENEAAFGRPGTGRAPAAYPKARILALIGLRSRMLANFTMARFSLGEQSMAEDFWPHVPDNSLVVFDREFINYPFFLEFSQRGHKRYWLTRAKKNIKGRFHKYLGPGDQLVWLETSAAQRRLDPTLPGAFLVRVIQYQRPGRKPQRLLTSLLDAELYPARELIALYHERWELELKLDEVKTDLLERRECLRCKQPELVLQELWGLAIAYNLIRIAMARAAVQAGIAPNRLSFRNSLWLVQMFLYNAWHVPAGTLAQLYAHLCEQIASFELPERRDRVYPRVVKIKMSGYKRKKPKIHAKSS